MFWTLKTISLDLKAGFDVAENRTEHQTDARCHILYFKYNYLITLFSFFFAYYYYYYFFISRSLEILTSLQLRMYFVIQIINYLG